MKLVDVIDAHLAAQQQFAGGNNATTDFARFVWVWRLEYAGVFFDPRSRPLICRHAVLHCRRARTSRKRSCLKDASGNADCGMHLRGLSGLCPLGANIVVTAIDLVFSRLVRAGVIKLPLPISKGIGNLDIVGWRRSHS